jgi:hypothetical protein
VERSIRSCFLFLVSHDWDMSAIVYARRRDGR